ncbi:DUF29 domain-containing protein [Dolichospermum sp. ST_con]|jgi:hypothetical protein|nr:DUF29 domain-containing protein [Dolichospermum sp. ST_con]MDD1420715.1 DUF29 domain-containing protein [Dolichospermum sp. ST_sed1]MDD1426125.1 DUF29 domain-containing protein [Dolichospermum sp. ST_sed9]MDD1432848.1 DUF29 domain-containing protein [Dolichospermum sp. ST_sed6]MDD1436437.1 DUF29 domain-containing protein [Dolichospermum sp. ST_sed10]MDD1442241.1 DUF29 domain-containing protein [Dolichospermum sp. ST_sed3]MDD1447977.1 DUF29 domain-containing protein [Dolichospermum sp. ST_s
MDNFSLYNQDFYAWTQKQAKALEQKLVLELDWQHLQEEVQSLGRHEYRELISRLGVLIGHLLKWEYQPEQRSRSWFLTIREQRRAIVRHLRQNPSLKSRITEAMLDAFEIGIDLALRETNLPLRTFPENCPYLFDDIIANNFLCDTLQDWEG